MKIKIQVVACLLLLILAGCSKKHQPQTTVVTTDLPEAAKPVEAKKPARKVVHTPVPKVITVDDRGAKKAVDGRLYYDLEGHRYWRNYKDGKYYIYREGMFDDPAFKPH
jgi:hypothetical protein